MSFWCQACWLASYYISIQIYQEQALHVVAIIELTINVPVVGGAVPCPLPWSFGVGDILVVGLDGSLFLSPNISKHLRWIKGRLRARTFFMSWHNSSQSSSVEPFGGVSSSTLDGFLRSDVQFLQLPRLLSQFRSIDHEKNISSCIARVAALRGTYENHSVGGATKDPCTLILIWDTGTSLGLTPFCSDFIDYVECDVLVRDVTKVN